MPDELHAQSTAASARDIELARIAWQYFENNYQPTTGLVNSVDNYPSTTLWDAASYMGALVSAYELGIIDKEKFDNRLTQLFGTFMSLSFFNNELPNKVYNTLTLAKSNYKNDPGEIGYSAVDLGRFLIWARIIRERYPQHAERVDRFVLRWNFCNILNTDGTLFGAALDSNGRIAYMQEGRLGYEEYAAKGFGLWGFTVARALLPEPYATRRMYDVDVPYDRRDIRIYRIHNAVVSEPYILDGIEMNWDLPGDSTSTDSTHSHAVMADFARRIYRVQEERYRRAGILTARSEHQLERAPFFVYDAIYSDGEEWPVITEAGEHVPEAAAVALKAAFGIHALWNTDYSRLLRDSVEGAYDPARGFYEGIYEQGEPVRIFTANNNGIILAALLYRSQGRIMRYSNRESLWDTTMRTDAAETNCRGLRREPVVYNDSPEDLFPQEYTSENTLLRGLTLGAAFHFPLRQQPPRPAEGASSQGERRNNASLSMTVKYVPADYFFASVTAYLYLRPTYQAPWDPDFTYSFGYDDWHPYTFSLVYGNYGGNRFAPESGTEERVTRFDEGTFSLGWKFPSPEAVRRFALFDETGGINHIVNYNLTPVYVAYPSAERKNWHHSLSFGTRYTIYGNTYLNLTLYYYPVAGQQRPWDPDFTYGFGYSDWRSGTFSLQYNNYAGNRYPWRARTEGTGGFLDGVISLSWSWTF